MTAPVPIVAYAGLEHRRGGELVTDDTPPAEPDTAAADAEEGE